MKYSITYPMSIEYVPDWNTWEIVRELVSNAQDTMKEWQMVLDESNANNPTLIITDKGEGIGIKNMLLGVSDKGDNTNAIGKFGEGLKLALVVCTRLNLPVTIKSGALKIQNFKDNLVGVEVMRLDFEDIPHFEGTEISIEKWTYPVYEDRFIFDPEDTRLLDETDYGALVDPDGDNPSLFVKGVWIKELENYAFSYNTANTTLGRDRNAASEHEVHQSIGRIWNRVQNPVAWYNFFRAVQRNCGEKAVYIRHYSMSEKAQQAFIEGFHTAYGEKTVIGTDENLTREAKHRGAKVVDANNFGPYVVEALCELVDTDKKFLEKCGAMKPKSVSLSKLSAVQKVIFSSVKKMAKKVGFNGTVEAAILPEGGAHYDPNTNTIRFHIDTLNDENFAKMVMIHELAHALYGTNDTTDAHVDACCKVGVLLMK